MSLPTLPLNHVCDVYRPFGAGSATATSVPCRLAPDLAVGVGKRTDSSLVWTHTLDLPMDADVRDGCSRTTGNNAIDFADGDEIRSPNGDRFVVVWVEIVGAGTPMEHPRLPVAATARLGMKTKSVHKFSVRSLPLHSERTIPCRPRLASEYTCRGSATSLISMTAGR
jgi:hypothetical protein